MVHCWGVVTSAGPDLVSSALCPGHDGKLRVSQHSPGTWLQCEAHTSHPLFNLFTRQIDDSMNIKWSRIPTIWNTFTFILKIIFLISSMRFTILGYQINVLTINKENFASQSWHLTTSLNGRTSLGLSRPNIFFNNQRIICSKSPQGLLLFWFANIGIAIFGHQYNI